MTKCPSCGYKPDSEWNYCVKCGTPRSSTNTLLTYKFVIMGPGGVGKSALSIRFINNDFISIYDPTIEDRYSKHLVYDNSEIMIDLLDTAGQETFSAMRELYVLNGDGFIFVYSITRKWSFIELQNFYTPLQRRRINNSPPLVIVGNKCDLSQLREVSSEQLADLAKEWNADQLEVSAKTGEGVKEIFLTLVRRLKEQNKPPPRRRGCILL